MTTIKISAPLVGAMIIIASLHTVAHASATLTRTYVSRTGVDSNPCTAPLPCQTFQAALALTVAGGEIYVLDSANYGPVTINKAVTITSEGAVAGIVAGSGVGITISAGANDVINLRGLEIDGSNTGSVGIQFNSGQSLNIQKSVIRNFTGSGITFAPSGTSSLFVIDTNLINNLCSGISLTNSATGALSRVNLNQNGVGVLAYGSGVSLTVTDTVAGNNTYGIGASSSAVMVRNSTLNSNLIGISADQSAMVRVGQSTITANATGWKATNGGQVLSYGNNNVNGNTTDGSSTTTVALE
jgi:Right handed beta helix region